MTFMHFFFHSPRKSRECMLHLCVAAWGFTHFLSIFCPPSAWQAALFTGLGIFSFWPALATIVLRFTAASNHWLLQHMLSAYERSVDCFLGVNLYLERFPFFSFCSLLFNLFRKLHLLRAHVRGKKKNVNDFCSNWFQQKTRDPWHHVF